LSLFYTCSFVEQILVIGVIAGSAGGWFSWKCSMYKRINRNTCQYLILCYKSNYICGTTLHHKYSFTSTVIDGI
jgi:hypothetical protein